MVAVDTNLVLRLVTVADDPAQGAAARRFVADGAWVPLLALAEAIWVLAKVYRTPPNALGEAIEALLDNQSLTLQDAAVVRAALALFRQHPRLGFSDCLILEQARHAGHLPLGTFDRELAKVAGAALP